MKHLIRTAADVSARRRGATALTICAIGVVLALAGLLADVGAA